MNSTVVFVHGVPETAAIWNELRAALPRNSVAVDLPGFGNPLPSGFTPNKDAYVDYVLSIIDAIPGPVDLVGHDWGSLITARIATAHGDRIRSWAADIGAVWHRDYMWHDFAQLWQSSPDGDEWMKKTVQDALSTPPSGFFEIVGSLGLPSDHIPAVAKSFDSDMAASILGLYRSAVPNAHATWAPTEPRNLQRSGLILQAAADPFDKVAASTEVATALNVDVAPLGDLGHFWMLDDPSGTAAVIDDWLNGVERKALTLR